MSQLDLALDADISARHLSFLESGRARPSREMVLNLAERLEVPLRERNSLLLAAGFAPVYQHRSLDDPALGAVRAVIDGLLRAHEPFPALAIDRHWTLLSANKGVDLLIKDVDPALLKPPVNVLRLSLHPSGLASRIRNLSQWRAHIMERLRHQCAMTADPLLLNLVGELSAYTQPEDSLVIMEPETPEVVVPLRIATTVGELSLISTTTVFGTPLDVTLSEIALETFFPANEETAAALQRACGIGSGWLAPDRLII